MHVQNAMTSLPELIQWDPPSSTGVCALEGLLHVTDVGSGWASQLGENEGYVRMRELQRSGV